jgi:hypothetical protein
MTSTRPAAATGLPEISKILPFPVVHRHSDPLSRQNLEHAYLAMHVAAQYDGDRCERFISELMAEDKAGDIADILNNNARAIRYLMGTVDFMLKADEAISAAADRIVTEALVAEGGAHVS